MNTTGTFAIPVIYAAIGFLTGYFIKRTISVVFIGLLVCILIRLLGTTDLGVDWSKVGILGSLLAEVASTILLIGKSFIDTANSLSLSMFLVGAIVSFFLTLPRR